MDKLLKKFRTRILPFVLILAIIVNVIGPRLIQPTVVYAAGQPVESKAAIAAMTVDPNVVLGSDNIIINGYNYVTSNLGNILNNANITRIPFNSGMAKQMLELIAAGGGAAITTEGLKGLGVALIGAFTKITLILALAGLAYYAYKVITEDGNSFNIYFLPDSLIIGNTHITGFTKPIFAITNYFDGYLKAHPNQDVVVPDVGTGEGSKPQESTEADSEAIANDLGGIASQYGIYECEEAANAMADYLKKQKKEFKFITMRYPPDPGTILSLSREAILGDYEKATISKNGVHYGIEYNGIVHCNVHPYGLPRAEWEADFWGPYQALRTITPP